MREALLFCFKKFCLKKSAAESHRMLLKVYGDNALSETTCRDWFRQFNDDLSDKKHEDCQLQALLNEDDTQSQKILPSNWMFLKQPFPCGYMGKVQEIRKSGVA